MRRTLWVPAFVAFWAMALVGTYVCTASAGWTNTAPVLISKGVFGRGAIGSVRRTADGNQYLYCAIMGNLTAAQPSVACAAADNSFPQLQISCTSSNANMVSAVQKVASDSYVYFVADSSGACTEIEVMGTSYFPTAIP